RGSRMAVDERQRAAPRVVRRSGEVLLLAIEEAVRRAVVRHDLVLYAGVGEGALESGVVVGSDALVGARLQGENRRLDLRGAGDGARPAALARRAPVEADRPGQAVPGGRGNPRSPAAEAEPDGEDRGQAEVAQVPDGRARVGLHPVVGRLVDVRAVL